MKQDLNQLSNEELMRIAGIPPQDSSAPQSADLNSLSSGELMKIAGVQTPEQVQPAANPALNFAKGVPQGLGNAAVGAVQAATDVGEEAAKLIEKIYFGDNLKMDTFGTRLAAGAKKREEEQANLPMSERAGIVVGETLPYIAGGASTGAKIAAKTGSRVAGFTAGGAVGGAEQSALSMQDQAGLENRAIETAKGAVTGAAFGGGLALTGKAINATRNATVQLGKDLIQGYKARPAEAVVGFINKPVETLDAVTSAIKDKSSGLYKEMREAGATIRPSATGTIFKEIDSALSDSGIMNQRLHGDTLGVVSDLKTLAKEKGGNIGIEELDQYRQLLGDVVRKNTDAAGKLNADAVKANIAIDKLDDVVENFSPNYLVKSGDSKAVELLNSARDEWKRYRKFDSIVNIVKKADGDANRVKTLMQNFVNNPKNLRGFSQAERDALRTASRNSNAEGLLKAVGKFGFDFGSGRNMGNTALPLGSILIGGKSGGMAAVVGTIARQAQKLSARGKVEDVLQLIQGQEPKIASKVIQNLSPKTRDFILVNLLTKSSSGNDAQASEPNMSEEEIRQQILKQKRDYPMLDNVENVDAEAKKIKQKYYR